MSREKTIDEIREELLDTIAINTVKCIKKSSTKEKAVIGAVFLVLTTLEGAGGFSSCVILPDPHESDKLFHEREGRDWYPKAEITEEQ